MFAQRLPASIAPPRQVLVMALFLPLHLGCSCNLRRRGERQGGVEQVLNQYQRRADLI